MTVLLGWVTFVRISLLSTACDLCVHAYLARKNLLYIPLTTSKELDERGGAPIHL